MKLYHYHPQTKEYLSVSEAIKSPLEQDVYLIPSNATTLEPLKVKVGFAVCFNKDNEAWEYIEDHREKTINHPDTKEEKECDYLGALEGGFIIGSYQKTLADFKAEKIQAITTFKDKRKQFVLNGKTDWLDSEFRSAYFNSIAVAKSQNQATIEYNGVDYPLTQAEGLLTTIHNYADTIERLRKQFIREVEALESIEAVKAFEYESKFHEILTL